MSKSNPDVSVVMPVYNSAKYLALAIESILNQTFKNFEFIIIDDGSNDSSLRIIKKYARKDRRIKILINPSNMGICWSLNYGISLARGKYIARMDSDDWSYPERLSKQISFMKKHPQAVICGGSIEVCNADLKILNKRSYPTSDKNIRKNLFRMNPFAHPAVMYQKDTVINAGEYNENLFTVEDYDLYFRLGNLGKFANITSTLLKLRVRFDSISYSNITRQTKFHLFVRLKAIVEYGYSWHMMDIFYYILGLAGLVIIPARHKIKMYNFLRDKYNG